MGAAQGEVEKHKGRFTTALATLYGLGIVEGIGFVLLCLHPPRNTTELGLALAGGVAALFLGAAVLLHVTKSPYALSFGLFLVLAGFGCALVLVADGKVLLGAMLIYGGSILPLVRGFAATSAMQRAELVRSTVKARLRSASPGRSEKAASADPSGGPEDPPEASGQSGA
jgi:hypothetical protein